MTLKQKLQSWLNSLNASNHDSDTTVTDAVLTTAADKTAIASAITDKGGTVTASDGYEDFSSAIAAIPSGGLHFNVVEVQGSGANSITVNIPNTSGTSCWMFYNTNYDETPSPEVIKSGYYAAFADISQSSSAARDSGGTSRTPTVTRNPSAGTIKVSSTRAFSDDAAYRFVYAEFNAPEPDAPMLLLRSNPDELNPEDALHIITGGED